MVLSKEKVLQLLNTSIGKRMASGTFWSFTGTAAAKVLVLISGILCAHILSKEQYGEFGMVRSTINMFVVFGTAGLGLTATKYISEYRYTNVNKDRIYSIYCITNLFAIVTGLLVTLVLLLMSSYLATNTLNSPHLISAIRIGSFLLFVTVINGAQNGVLLGFENFKSRALNTLYGSIAESAFMLLGAYFWGVLGAITGFGLGFLLLFFCNYFSIRNNLKSIGIESRKIKIEKSDYKLLYSFSLPAALASIMIGPVYWIIRSILVQNDGFSELAIYEAADYWKALITYIPGAISHIILPILSSLSNNTETQYWKVFKLNLSVNVGITTVIALLVIIGSPWIMNSYGPEYEGKNFALILLAASTIFSSASSTVGLAITSRAKMWVGLLFNVIWAVLLVGLSYYFIQIGLGATGISLALLIAYIIHTIYQLIYLKIII